ncbi:MAG: DNA-3-methyladenine glycosylase 2 family protein [Spirochaetales bacterium]|nr:DNA-3-methyladenine glycosylase 2 family protein [Spirochaetales bacterium]
MIKGITEKQLSLKDTLPSGQCFRFAEHDGVWTVKAGVGSGVRVLNVSQDDLSPITEDPFWAHFFDLETDYESLKADFSAISPFMADACSYAPGIRILNQDPWEALCSFVVSQNNNIKRIMGIIDRMCNFYGGGGFPEVSSLVDAKEDDLRMLGLGFRAPYIVNTARAVHDGTIDLEKLKSMDIDAARAVLMKVKGIGPKVADCALLFGCHRLDCFPMDVWMKRVMAECFPGQDKSIFGPYAGVAQQYLFHYARTSGYFSSKED